MKKYSQIFTFLLFFILTLITVSGINSALGQTPTPTPGQNNIDQTKYDDLKNKIAELQAKISDTQNQAKTLSDQIGYMDNQIQLTLYQMEGTQEKLTQIAKDIDKLITKISKLETSLDDIAAILLNRIRETYVKGTYSSFDLLLSVNGFSEFLNRLKYIKVVQTHDKNLMIQVQTAKVNYEEQKTLLEEKKLEQENLKKRLQGYKVQLDVQKNDKEQLLVATQNDEKKYQELLAKAKQELSGFSAFTVSAGGGLTSFGSGSNGWYYTQRDPAWGNMILPGSSVNVLNYGCAVTSVAMVCKSYGQNISPVSIAGDSSKFFYGDLLNSAFACNGKTTNWIGSSQDEVKSYVKDSTPVILRLMFPNKWCDPSKQECPLHFIVAFSWDDGKNDFKIHDPYFGPDKLFSERYNWSQVTTAIAIQ